jgi:hypothetical protein
MEVGREADWLMGEGEERDDKDGLAMLLTP